MADPTTYEVFPPEAVGLTRRYVLGKYSGVDTLKRKLEEHGLAVSEDEAVALTYRVRSKSVALKRALFDDELIDTYEAEIASVRDELAEAGAAGEDPVEAAARDAVAALSEVADES
ncbi:MAG: homocitrate synthase/isopropylmalate synthase family protein, partial [Thermoleophilia bacterium]